jgi:hypothetical protein
VKYDFLEFNQIIIQTTKIKKMKTFRLFLSIAFLVSSFHSLWASAAVENCDNFGKEDKAVACSISSFQIIEQFCNEDGAYIVFFIIDGVDFGLNGYTITATNTNQVFNYTPTTEPYFYLPADCNESVFVTITDNDNPTCNATVELGRICCECVFNGDVIQSDCDAFSFDATISLSRDGSCDFYTPIVTVNGIPHDFTINSQQILLSDISTYSPEIVYEVCFNIPNFPTPCFTVTKPNPCFPLISNFHILEDSSYCLGDSLIVKFDYDGPNFGVFGFTVSSVEGGNKYFNIGDEYTYSVPADCFENIVISIFDNNFPDYTLTDTIGPVCCPCNLDYTYNLSNCINNQFDISIDINELSGSCFQNDIILTINGDTIPTVINDTLHLISDYQSQDSILYFILCSNIENTSICYRDTLVNPCYEPNANNPCAITNFSVTPDSSSCTGEVISLDFNVTGTDLGDNGYTVTTNTGFSQFFNANDTSQFTLLADCDENIIVTITDANDSLCTAVDTIGTLCCPCHVDVAITQSDCVDGTFTSTFVINNIQGSCINYDWSLTINGQNYTLNPTNTGFVVTGITSNDSLLIYALCTLVPDLPYCFMDTLVNPCYQPINNNPCAITNFSVTPDSTSCTGEVISLDFNVTGTDLGDNGYTVTTNTGFSQFFNANDPSQFTLLADCDENIIVTITDANDSLCTAVDTIGTLCCPCHVDVAITQSNCVDGTFTSSFAINNIQGSCINYDWSLTINGQNYTLNPTNTGFAVNGITSNDSLLVYQYCYLVPSQPECDNITLINPCFDSTVATKDITMEDLLQITLVHGEHISIFNKSENSLDFNIYSINGQLLESIKTLHSHNNISLDISNWPSGTYILKAFNEEQTVSKKLINIK